jgi:AcrR family transcriptional regulator
MSNVKGLHPTKQVLIDTVVKMMDKQNPSTINSDDVLELSGISKGSLYHHFEDFSELIEHALVARFASFVDQSIYMLSQVAIHSKNKSDFVAGIKEVTRVTQAPERFNLRAERVTAISTAMLNPRMKENLGAEQERLTQALADLFRESIERGWGNPAFDARAVAVLVQAYTIGQIVDDFSPAHMAPEAWYALIDALVNHVFFSEGN